MAERFLGQIRGEVRPPVVGNWREKSSSSQSVTYHTTQLTQRGHNITTPSSSDPSTSIKLQQIVYLNNSFDIIHILYILNQSDNYQRKNKKKF